MKKFILQKKKIVTRKIVTRDAEIVGAQNFEPVPGRRNVIFFGLLMHQASRRCR
jgi:hypothetical protein